MDIAKRLYSETKDIQKILKESKDARLKLRAIEALEAIEKANRKQIVAG